MKQEKNIMKMLWKKNKKRENFKKLVKKQMNV